MALEDTLPEGWGQQGSNYFTPEQKINYFNQAGITQSQLEAAKVPQSDIQWMLEHGYTGTPKSFVQETGPTQQELIDIVSPTAKAPTLASDYSNRPDFAQAYQQYKGTLTGGEVTPDLIKQLYGTQAPEFAQAVTNLHDQIAKQQAAGTGQYWYAGNTKSADNAAWDFALRLAEKGVGSLADLQRKTETADLGIDEYGNPVTQQTDELINKATGKSLGYLGGGSQFDSSSNLDLDYRIMFDNQGNAIPIAGNRASEWAEVREGIKPMLSMLATAYGLGPYVAAGNAAYAASKGDWEKAIMSGLSAAAPLAQSAGLDASTVSSLQTAKQVANVIQALDNNNLLGAALGGADLAGISQVAGIDVKDVGKAVNVANAVMNADKNPAGLVNALIPYGKTSSAAGVSETPLSDEEQAQLQENRWQRFLRNLPETNNADLEAGVDERTQELLAQWASQGDPNAPSGVSGDEFSDFLRSIGIENPTDLGPSPTNQDILDFINYVDPSTVVVKGDRPVGETSDEVLVTTPRPTPTNMGEMVITAPRPTPTNEEEVVITTPRPTTTPTDEVLVTTTKVTPTTEPTDEVVVTTTKVTPTTEPTDEIVVTTTKVTPTTEPTQTTTPSPTPTPTPTPTQTVKPTVQSTYTGFTMPQAQAVAATFGLPQLANVFYYGKDFGSKKQKLKDGEVEEEEYKPLSVTKAGEVGEALEEAEIAQAKKTKENDVNGLIEQILGKSQDNVGLDDLLNIVKGS